MSKLAAALAWAQRGFAVFPLRENSKKPVHEEDWNAIATTDLNTVRSLWTNPSSGAEYDYNIGCACTDMVVIDIDIKKGKDGYNEYLQMGGTFETLTVRTPSGGLHCYFYGPDSSNASLSNAVDVRSHRGYVVAPGSYIDGIPYVVEENRDMNWIPSSIERMLEGPKIRNKLSDHTHIDTPAAIEQARNFLESAPPAIEGMRGDETTFTTAARLVREMSLSVPTAFAMMRDIWNPRCQPPWELEDLYTKVDNAYQYGTAEAGRLTPETLYGHLSIPPAPGMFEQLGSFGNAYLGSQMSARPWLVQDLLMRRTVTLLLAAGSAGKSSLSLALAAHLSLGIPFAGYTVKEACRTIVYNGEDDIEEQSRRLTAICTIYGLDYDKVRQNIMLLSARELKIQLVTKEQGKATRNDSLARQFTEFAAQHRVGCIVLDPLVKLHQCDESDNAEMDLVMETITDIAHNANVAMLVLHHTTKVSMKQEDRVGNADVARGASAIVNAARVALTLLNASRTDAEEYGFASEERNKWVRLDDAKMNMSLANSTATWFHKESDKIITGDVVGVLKYTRKERDTRAVFVRIAEKIEKHMRERNMASMTVTDCVALVRDIEELWRNKRPNEATNQLKQGLRLGVAVPSGATVQCTNTNGKDEIVLR